MRTRFKAILVAFAMALASLVAVASPASAGTDDYPSQWRNVAMDSVVDSWGLYNRECTSFTAWRLSSRNGFTIPWAYGDATQWGGHATNDGYAVNMTPALGAVAWWSSGHVAWVESVNSNSTVTIEEYNVPGGSGAYNERTISTSSVSGYIHFKDIAGSAAGYQTVFQANTGNMYSFGSSGSANLGLGMMNGTSPSVAALPSGGFQRAFQANTGNLWVSGDAGTIDTAQGMMAGTSPSIAASPKGGYQAVFQANTGSMFTYNSSTGPANWNLGMMNGTSPSIAALPGGGYEMAFQANTGNLWVVGDAGWSDTGQGMMAGTSPSIAASPKGGFQVAFQANTGYMFIYNSSTGPANWNLGMMSRTSPSIAALPGGGYEMAFQANTGNLWVVGDAKWTDTAQGMMSGTSPSIAASSSGGFEAAFQANTGNLFVYDSASGPSNTQQGMMNGTSPGIATH